MRLVFAPKYNTDNPNTVHQEKDAQNAFQPEARAFCLAHGIREPVRLFDNNKPMPARLSEMLAWLDLCRPGTVDTVAFFCHGFKTGLQCGVTAMNAPRFATALERVCAPGPRIIMYVCDAARDADDDRADDLLPGPGGEGGFADQMRDELVKRGVMATIYAHATVGHTTRNPFVRRFDSDDLAGGRWIVEPHSARWCAWVRALRGPLRFAFPFMTQADIDAELQSPPVA